MTTIVIDTLDECDPNKRTDLLEALETILSGATQLVKMFVSSRDDQDIVWSLQHYPNLRISSTRNMEDISAFVRTEVESLIRKGKLLRFSNTKDELKKLVGDEVLKGANGMLVKFIFCMLVLCKYVFRLRWANLQLFMYCGIGNDSIRERLEKLPPTLKQLYNETHEMFTNCSLMPSELSYRMYLLGCYVVNKF